MKSFIKSQENIIKEICNKDFNYKGTSLAFIEKTLKVATNETDKSAYDLIEEYITNDELLHKIHKLRMDANEVKHHKDEEFDYSTAMNYLKTLNQYLAFVQNHFNNTIETTDFINLYEKTKNELEKKRIVEKKVNVIKKEIVTVEKPIYKEIIKEGNNVDNNTNYTEVQLLNESNNKGLLYNAIHLKKYDYAVDILNKKIEHNLKLSLDEEEAIVNDIKDIYDKIKYQLNNEKTFLYFNNQLIIDMIMIEKDNNLIYQYLSLKDNYDLLNEKLYELLGYYIDNNDNAIKIIISFKEKFKPIEKLRICVSKHLDVSKTISFFNSFENDDIKETITFDKLSNNYNVEYNDQLVKYVEKYRWGRFLIVDDYINNKDTIITYDIFERNYLKIDDNKEINESIISSNSENALNIIKKFDKKNIQIVDSICEYISSSDGFLYENNLSEVNRKIMCYCIDKNYFKNDTLINNLFLYYLNKLDYEIVDKLIDKKLYNEKDFYRYRFDCKISNDKEYELLFKFYTKNKFLPVYFLAKMYEYNYELSCQRLNEYLKDNIILTAKYYFTEDRYGYKEKTYYFSDELRFRIYKTFVNEENDRSRLYNILYCIIKEPLDPDDDFILNSFIEIINIVNKKDFYLKDVLSKNFIKDNDDFFEELFNYDIKLINNLDENKKLPIFSNDFIIKHYDDKFIKIILNNKKKSVGSLIRDVIKDGNYSVVKKIADSGIDFTKINDGIIENKTSIVYRYHETKEYDSAFDYYRVECYYYSHDDKIYAFLAYIKAKQFIKNQKFILNRNIDKHDFLDDLLIKPRTNSQVLKILQDEYDLKELYEDFLKTPSKSFNDFKKKLFIDSNYLDDKCNYDELMSFKVTQINQFQIEFDKLKNIFDYYCKLNDDEKINKIIKLNDENLIRYIKTSPDLLDKVDSLANINKNEKNNKSSNSKEKNKKELLDDFALYLYGGLVMHIVLYIIVGFLTGVVMEIFEVRFTETTFSIGYGFNFFSDLLIEIIAFIVYREKHLDFKDVAIPTIIIIILFNLIILFALGSMYEDTFMVTLHF